MKKIYIILFIVLLFSGSVFAQSTETFETETDNSTSFTDNGQVFNITSQAGGTFDIANFAGTGWNGTAADNKYIDNSNSADIGVPTQFTIKSAGSSLFTLKSIYLNLRQSDLNPGAGTCTIVGKLANVTVFTATSSTGFNSNNLVNNGYTNIDLTSYGGANNSDIVLDEYVITTTGTFEYVALDAMKWDAIHATIATSGTINAFNSCSGTASAEQSFMVSGTLLIDNIVVTAPTGYEVSTTSDSSFASTLTLTQNTGSVGSTQIYVRMSAIATGNPTGNITLTSNTATTKNIAVVGSLKTTPIVTSNPPNRLICSGSNTTFPTAATGATSYQWQISTDGGTIYNDIFNDAVYSNTSTPFLSITAVTPSMTGFKYRCRNSNTCGATDSNGGTLTVDNIIPTQSAQINVTTYGGSNGSATVTPTGGISPYTYSWSPSGGTAATASGLAAGTYTVTVTDNIGCSKTSANYVITQPAGIGTSTSLLSGFTTCSGTASTSQNFLVFGDDLTDDIVISAPNGYEISTSSASGFRTTVNLLPIAGKVTSTPIYIRMTDLASGTMLGNVAISSTGVTSKIVSVTGTASFIAFTAQPSDQTVCLGSNISFTATAVNNTGYQWQVSTDAGLNFNNITDDATYSGSTTNTVTITGATAAMNNYKYRVIASGTCPSATSNNAILTVPTITGIWTATPVSCRGGSNGSATITPSGGNGTYTYSWSPSGGTGTTATGLVAGTYSVKITDSNMCSTTINNIVVSQPTAILSGLTTTTLVSCKGGSNGTATVTPSGGTLPYTYQWSSNAGSVTTQTATSLAAGATYSVTITDNNSCTYTINNITITEPAAALSGTASTTSTSCNGGANGTATATPAGGNPPYTYLWASNAGSVTTQTATGLAAGSYDVIISDANGCQFPINNIAVDQPSKLVATNGAQTDVSCNGGTNGSATVNVTGGTGTYTYSWAPSGGTAATATGLKAGTYTVTVTDANICQTTQSFTITEPQTLVASGTQTNVLCQNSANGTATVSVTGGTGAYTYVWAPSGGTAATAIGLTAGTYNVTVTDANACQTTQSFTITEPPVLSATTSQIDATCTIGGQASVTVNGGTSAYTYLWTPSGATTAAVTGLSSGNHSCLITDANGCTIVKNFVIGTTNTLTATTSQTEVLCNGTNTGSATVAPSGAAGPFTYTWSPSGGNAATATNLTAGSYNVTIAASNGCSIVKNFTITEPPALSVTSAQTDLICNGGTNGSATVNVTGGTGSYTYVWAPSGGTAATATGLAAGNYTVTIKDANLCQTTQSFIITQPDALLVTPSQSDVSCNGLSNGSATATVTGGTGMYTYLWAPSGGTSDTASGLSAGTYTVTITDANLCQTTQSFTITEPNNLVASVGAQNNVSCNLESNGSASVNVTGGTPGYTYLWTPSGGTSDTATGLTAGIYTVTVTDANACSTSQSFTITEPTALVASAGSQTNLLCNGDTNGSASVNVTGGTGSYTYLWSPSGGTSDTATGLTAGTYTVTVTDANACSTSQAFTITEPTALVASAGSQTDVSCNLGKNGSATVNVTGGTGTYSYLWAPSGGTSDTATGLTAGTYTVTVTDANACSTSKAFTITEPTALVASAGSQTDVSCNLGKNGSATVNVTGGTGAYTYLWAPSGGTSDTATGLSAGTYTVTVTDANACSTSQSFTITEPTALVASAGNQTDVSCNLGTNGSATVNVTGGTGAYTYLWSPSGGTSNTATGLTAGTYTVTVTDANSCSTSQSFTIKEPLPLTVIATQNNVICYNGNNGNATVAISGGTAPYSYKWTNSDSIDATANNLAEGNYTCTITDSNNCIIDQNFTITQPTSPIGLMISLPTEVNPSGATLTVNASPNGIDADQGECTTEIGIVYATVSNPTVTDTKTILGNTIGSFTKAINGLEVNKIYYLRAYAINKNGYVNYGNEVSFSTQKYVLKVVANSNQTKVFGNAEPVLTYSATGFVNGDNNSILTGSLSRENGEDVASYPITVGSLSAGSNYAIDFVTSNFEITKANQVIEWSQVLAFGCDTNDDLQLNASSNSGLPVSYVIENTSIAELVGDKLEIVKAGTTSIKVSQEGDKNHNAALPINKSIDVSQFGAITQHWEDVLFFDNSDKKYSAFQWYKDGILIPGANGQYYSEKPLKGVYYLQAKDENGDIIKFCPLTLEGKSFSRAIKVYPNPVESLKEFTIESNFSEEQLKGSTITIYDLSGKVITTVPNVSLKTVVSAPASSAIYVVILTLADGQKKTINLLVR